MVCLLSNQNGYVLTSVADCQECMAYVPQVNSAEEGNAAQGNSASAFHAIESNLEHIGSASQIARNKGKRH